MRHLIKYSLSSTASDTCTYVRACAHRAAWLSSIDIAAKGVQRSDFELLKTVSVPEISDIAMFFSIVRSSSHRASLISVTAFNDTLSVYA
jgi:hypothetical protein